MDYGKVRSGKKGASPGISGGIIGEKEEKRTN